MKNKHIKALRTAAFVLSSIFLLLPAMAEEKIIKQEKISFEKCLQVINTSENKLAVEPEIKDISDQKRVAIFALVDGTLTIACDGEEGNVTVSTKLN